jgi:hypothetical protein
MNKIIRITSKRDGFRRGGIAHPFKATDYDVSVFSKKQLEALKSEPMLVVEEAEVFLEETSSEPSDASTAEWQKAETSEKPNNSKAKGKK